MPEFKSKLLTAIIAASSEVDSCREQIGEFLQDATRTSGNPATLGQLIGDFYALSRGDWIARYDSTYMSGENTPGGVWSHADALRQRMLQAEETLLTIDGVLSGQRL